MAEAAVAEVAAAAGVAAGVEVVAGSEVDQVDRVCLHPCSMQSKPIEDLQELTTSNFREKMLAKQSAARKQAIVTQHFLLAMVQMAALVVPLLRHQAS